MQRAIEDPAVICDLAIRIVQQVGSDGLRLFVKPESIRVARAGDEFIALYWEISDRIGHGGGELVPTGVL